MMTTFAIVVTGVVLLSYAAAGQCPLGFVGFKNSCYWFSSTTGTFAEAGSICRFMESHLVRIKSYVENDFIRGHLLRYGRGRHYFIGGTDFQQEGRFAWEGENHAMTFTNWAPNQPSNGNNHDCILVDADYKYRWNDYICQNRYNFICEK